MQSEIDPQIGQQCGARHQPRQAKGRRVRGEKLLRMRVEQHHPQRGVFGLSQCARIANHLLMADMHAVKIADCQNRALRRLRASQRGYDKGWGWRHS